MPNRRAFTLIELLVVIAILIVLAGILWPVLQIARSRAQEAACMANVRQLGLAEHMYEDDNDEWLPIGAYNSAHPVPGTAVWDTTWHDLLLPYLGNRTAILVCPSVSSITSYRTSYGASPWLLLYYDALPEYRIGDGERIWMAEHQTGDWPSVPRDFYDDSQHRYLSARHNGRTLVVYLDGHAKSVPPASLSGHPALWQP